MEKLQLKELVDIYLGVTHTPKYVYAGVPFLSVKDISGGQINFDNCKYISEEEYNSLSQGAKPQVGDMLFCRVGTIGKPIIIPKGTPRFGSFVSLGYLRNKDNSRCRMDYLKHWMNSKSFYDQVQSNVKGASQVNLNTGWLSKFEVRLPDYRAQSDIVATLDLCERIINNRNLELQKLDNLIKARFVEFFGMPITNAKGWKTEPMDKVAPAVNYSGNFGEDVWLLNLDMIESQTGKIIDYLYVTKDEVGNSTCTFDTSNVLYSKLRPYLNKVVIPDRCGYATSELVPLQPVPSKLNREYLAYMLRSDEFVNIINEKVAGAKMPRVSMGDFRKFNVPIPPIELQNQFATFVKQVDKSKVAIQKSLAETQLLFDKLMQDYFG